MTVDGVPAAGWSAALAPTLHGAPTAPGVVSWNAFQSSVSVPSHRLTVPPELWLGVRCVGALTHRKLVLVGDHGLACSARP